MSEGNGPSPRPGRLDLAAAMAGRRRAEMVGALRGLSRAPGAREGPPGVSAPGTSEPEGERCDLCQRGVPDDHRHLLDLHERRIVCACEGCWALRSGDPDLCPVGTRTAWLEDFELPEDVWAGFRIPIGLAFFLRSTVTDCVVALYPSPAGATESELHFDSWQRLVTLNPVLAELESDVEALVVNRMSDPPAYAIAPIDRCYELVGLIKVNWQGISGGSGVADAVSEYFDRLHAGAVAA